MKQLTDQEVLSHLVGVEGARLVLERWRSPSALERASSEELVELLGVARTARLVAAQEMGRRAAMPRVRPRLWSAQDVYRYARPRLAHLRREEIHVLSVDTKHGLIRDECVAQGGLATCALSPRDLFEAALRVAAPGIILVHNHPSGDPTPSADDIDLTRLAIEGGRLLGIDVWDHVVIGDGDFKSIREDGYLDAEERLLGSDPKRRVAERTTGCTRRGRRQRSAS